MSANHEDDLSAGRRYKKYEGAYNLAFAADPNPQQRRFDEMAPKNDIQWKRLEVFRGNDRDAYHAYQSNPNDALVRPEEKERAMWEANQADKWRIDREPAFDQHAMTNNKWFDLSLEERRGDSAQKYFASVEQRHGASYAAWANKAGNQVVAKEDYLQTMASLDIEAQQAKRAQKLTQTQVQSTPVAQSQPTQQPTQQPAEPQAPKRTRLSLAEFQGPTSAYIDQTHKQLAAQSKGELKQVVSATAAEYQAKGRGQIEDAGPKIQMLNTYHAREEQQRNKRQLEVPYQTLNQQLSRQQ